MYICMEPILVHIINGGGEGHNPFYSIRLEADGMMLMDRGMVGGLIMCVGRAILLLTCSLNVCMLLGS